MDRQIIIILLSVLFGVSCYDSFDSRSPSDEASQQVVTTSTIKALHEAYATGVREVCDDMIVEGVVTSSDESGNFFKSIIIEEDHYALELLVGIYSSYISYPLGSRLVVRLRGLGLDRYQGVLRAGLIPESTSSYSLDYMEAEVVADRFISIVAIEQEPVPQEVSFETTDADMAGMFIRLNDLTLHSEEGIERTWSGYALFRTSELDSLWCDTSTYADFAIAKIPLGSVDLCGILQYGSTDSHTDQLILKLRDEADCIY